MTGAKARLFAEVCLHYMHTAEDACNDTPSEVPIFSWLSPYQRVQLVKDLMVGLLCEKEPLPPGTIQHYAAYRAVVQTIKTEVSVELDMQWDVADVGEDLRLEDYDREGPCRSEEEMQEWKRNRDLIRNRAKKNKRKLDKEGDADVDFIPEEEKEDIPIEDQVKEYIGRMQEVIAKIFDGPPLSTKQRERIRKPTTEDEKFAFRWRRLCDEAFQEEKLGCFPLIPPLSVVSFDFRSNSRKKWYTTIDVLFVNLSKVKADKKEKSLADGAIDECAYADVSQHARIQSITKHISILRKTYERTWDPVFLAQDQRCIYAVCSSEAYAGFGHKEFVNALLCEFEHRGIPLAEPGYYQERYNVYREIAPSFQEGLKRPFHAYWETCMTFEACSSPVDYKADDEEIWISCDRNGCFTYTREKLQKCSRCRVAYYCSRECQVCPGKEQRTSLK